MGSGLAGLEESGDAHPTRGPDRHGWCCAGRPGRLCRSDRVDQPFAGDLGAHLARRIGIARRLKCRADAVRDADSERLGGTHLGSATTADRRRLAENLDVPWGIAFLSSGDALVSERNTGRIIKITSKGKTTTVGEIAGVVPPGDFGEGGLMGIALAPGDEETLFAFLTTRSDDRLVRVSLAGGKVGKPRSVLDGFQTNVNHHGGRLLFDAEGLLYVSTGDAGQSELAQDRDALNGKILRLRPDGRAAPGNPFDNRTWSYGHRNIEGLAFDAAGPALGHGVRRAGIR